MSDVFISYSRRDAAFVEALRQGLGRSGREVGVDLEGIPPTADWLAEVKAAIESAETFVFVLSPDSLSSDVCQVEVAHAAGHSKRIMRRGFRRGVRLCAASRGSYPGGRELLRFAERHVSG